MISHRAVFLLMVLCAVVYCRPDVQTNVISNKKVDTSKNEIKADIEKAIEEGKMKISKGLQSVMESKVTDEKNEQEEKPKKKKKNNNKTKVTKAPAVEPKISEEIKESEEKLKMEISFGCNCGIFMSGHISKGNKGQPTGNPVLMQEQEGVFSCTPLGTKQCTSKCLETIVRHLPNSPQILCGIMDGDCHKERAYLFVQNCNAGWTNTKLSAGREYCCKDGKPYTCPLI